MAINKTIHYCWFGHEPMPIKEEECVKSWREFFTDYEFILWNEENFDYKSCAFAKQAYDNKKYAFVSDYARAKILYEYGGLYLDTDLKVLRSFNKLLEQTDAIVGFERKAFIGTAIIGCAKHDSCIKELLDYYETHDFVQKDGSFDCIANVSIWSDILKEKGVLMNGERQYIAGYDIYNRELFYPKKLSDTEFRITDETVAVHMCSNSWLSEREKKRGSNRIWIEIIRPVLRTVRSIGIKFLGKEYIRELEIRIRNVIR